MEFYYQVIRCRNLRKYARLYVPVIMDMFSLDPRDINVNAYRKESGYAADTIKKRLAEIGVRIVRNQSGAPGYFEVPPGYRGLDPCIHPNIRFRDPHQPPPNPQGPLPDRKPTENTLRTHSKEAATPSVSIRNNASTQNRWKPRGEEVLSNSKGIQKISKGRSTWEAVENESATHPKPLYTKVFRENKNIKKTGGTHSHARTREQPPSPQSIPGDFGWTRTLDHWAREKHPHTPLTKLRGFLESVFIPQNRAKGYRYVDHERAFMVWVARELENPRGWFAGRKSRPYRRTQSREDLEAHRREKFARFCRLVEATDAR